MSFSGFHILFTQQLSIQPGSRNHNSGVLTDALAQGQASFGPGEGRKQRYMRYGLDMEDMWDSTIKNENLSLQINVKFLNLLEYLLYNNIYRQPYTTLHKTIV